jgi:hypothetical protein
MVVMPSDRARFLSCGSGLLAAIFILFWAAPPAKAAKRLIRHFPTSTWCSVISGYDSDVDLNQPYVFVPPAGRTRVMLTFTADNVSSGGLWNNQRIDDVVVLPLANLPAGSERVCFNQEITGGGLAARPPLFPGPTVTSLFRDEFTAGAKPEWGAIPAETPPPDGAAPAPAFWTALGAAPETEILYESFEDDLAQGWAADPVAPQNLWRADASDCGGAAFGTGQLAFARPFPDCDYDADLQGPFDAWFVSPSLDLGGATSAVLQFRHRWDAGGDAQWAVEGSTDDGATWTLPLDGGAGAAQGWVNKQVFLPTGIATFRLRFRFTATIGSGQGWFLDDVSVAVTPPAPASGALALGRSIHVNGDENEPFVDAGQVVARLNLTGLTPGASYALMVRWNASEGTNDVVTTETTRLILNHVFDPALSSPTHTPDVWSNAAQVTVQWSGAVSTDEAGNVNLAGYSTAFDASASTTPDTTVETAHGTDPHSFTSTVLADGGSYHFHLRTCDADSNCTAASHFGPFRIDRTAPGAPASLASTSHVVGVPSLDGTIDMSWAPGTDASSGVDGYAFSFDNDAAWTCDQVKDVEESVTTATSPTLAPGSWYFHVCTRDNAGNWSGAATAGPYTIDADATPPTNPTLSSPTHTPGVWSATRPVTVNWSGSSDAGGSGVAGYSTLFDAAPSTSPDATIETAHASDPHQTTSASLADGSSHHFHLRACDQAQNCSASVHLGPFLVDGTAPGTPAGLASTSHVVGVASSDPVIDMTWTPSSDASSGLDGYAYIFDASPTWTCDQVKDLEEGSSTAASPALGSGAWFFHVCARDNAGNWSGVASAGPYTISSPPSGQRLHTLTPCRLVDTREPSGAPALAAGGERVLNAAARCGIPSTARALSVNVTVVGPSAAGHLVAYPAGTPVPGSSVINYLAGQTRANNAIVPLNGAAQLAVRCGQASGTVHLLVDVNGYFE